MLLAILLMVLLLQQEKYIGEQKIWLLTQAIACIKWASGAKTHCRIFLVKSAVLLIPQEKNLATLA